MPCDYYIFPVYFHPILNPSLVTPSPAEQQLLLCTVYTSLCPPHPGLSSPLSFFTTHGDGGSFYTVTPISSRLPLVQSFQPITILELPSGLRYELFFYRNLTLITRIISAYSQSAFLNCRWFQIQNKPIPRFETFWIVPKNYRQLRFDAGLRLSGFESTKMYKSQVKVNYEYC